MSGRATSNRVLRFLLARHACGNVVAAIINDPSWSKNALELAEFRVDMAKRGYPVQSANESPPIGEWCECFNGVKP